MFGFVPSEDVKDDVRLIMSQKPEIYRLSLKDAQEAVYKELMMIYGVGEDIEQRPDFPQLWKLMCRIPTAQRRITELFSERSS